MIGLVAVAFVAGSIMTGTMVYAEHKPDHQTNSGGLVELQKQVDENTGHVTVLKGQADDLNGHVTVLKAQVDSFFDVFFDIDVGATSYDSFFDIFVDAGEERTVDSFFDIFVELDQRDQHFDTEILSMDLRVSDLENVRPPTETTAASGFLKIGDIKGESTDNAHKDWIIIESFSQGQSRSDGVGPRGSGHVIFTDITIAKELDKSSPKIAEAVANGKHFSQVDLELTRSTDSGRVTYYAYELTNVLVTSYSISGSGQSEDVPVENFSLNFEEIKVTYTEYDKDGKKKGDVEYTWKVEEGES